MNLFTITIPLIIYSLLLIYGITYIKSQSTRLQIKNTKKWYVFLILMPFVALLFFHFTEVKK
jgi:hypothetical protein